MWETSTYPPTVRKPWLKKQADLRNLCAAFFNMSRCHQGHLRDYFDEPHNSPKQAKDSPSPYYEKARHFLAHLAHKDATTRNSRLKSKTISGTSVPPSTT